MAIQDLISFWENNVPFNIKKKIGELKDTCCQTMAVNVLDFDATKDKFLELIGYPENIKPNSVDAIFYHRKKQALCFLEMKGQSEKEESDRVLFVKEKIEECIPKFIDSVYVLISALGYYKVGHGLYPTMLHPKKLRISPFIIINLKEIDLAPIRTLLTPQLNIKLCSRIQTPINLITCEDIDILFA